MFLHCGLAIFNDYIWHVCSEAAMDQVIVPRPYNTERY